MENPKIDRFATIDEEYNVSFVLNWEPSEEQLAGARELISLKILEELGRLNKNAEQKTINLRPALLNPFT